MPFRLTKNSAVPSEKNKVLEDATQMSAQISTLSLMAAYAGIFPPSKINDKRKATKRFTIYTPFTTELLD